MITTQADLARICGVSVVTANRALQGRADVAPETRRRILDVARQRGYRVNAAARAMRRGRFGQIGLLQSSTFCRASMSAQALWGVEQELRSHNLLLCTGQVGDEELREPEQMPRILTDWSVDGLLVSYTGGAPDAMVAELLHGATPAVWINAKMAVDSVRPDDHDAGYRATVELLKLGHRNIAHLSFSGGTFPHYSVLDRRQGYIQAMQEAGLTPRDLYPVPNRILRGAEAQRAVRQWLAEPDRPTALVCYSVCEALLSLHAAALQGLHVPRDLSIATVGDEAMASLGITVATAVFPAEEMGRRAVRMLLRRIEHPQRHAEPEMLSSTMQVGETIAPPQPQ